MVSETENIDFLVLAVTSYAFENRCTVVESVDGHVDFSLLPRNEFTIHPYCLQAAKSPPSHALTIFHQIAIKTCSRKCISGKAPSKDTLSFITTLGTAMTSYLLARWGNSMASTMSAVINSFSIAI
ncbi:hypothetical protein HRbin03_00333 [archaeon HR03]|nr:hypothetical protein HRbin03_00333 [archaeon HR03]